MVQRPPPATVPTSPGVYQFTDAGGRVVYVGKAKNLRQRLNAYFGDPTRLHPRTQQMLDAATEVSWLVVANEAEALLAEHNLVYTLQPPFNVRLRNDASQPTVVIKTGEFPRLTLGRLAVGPSRGRPSASPTATFGPFTDQRTARAVVDELSRLFGLRTCTDATLARHHKMQTPCLLAHVGKCSAPCVGRVDATEYAERVTSAVAFMAGGAEALTTELHDQMHAAASTLDFEHAARLRDRAAAVTAAAVRQRVVDPQLGDVDAAATTFDATGGVVAVVRVRHGRVVAYHTVDVDGVVPDLLDDTFANANGSDDPDTESTNATTNSAAAHRDEAVAQALLAMYSTAPHLLVPPLVVLSAPLRHPETLATALSQLRAAQPGRGYQVTVRTPQRGPAASLVALASQNAAEAMRRRRIRRRDDHVTRTAALVELQTALGLEVAPLRIECFDLSHLGGTNYVGSMVVLEDGLPRPSAYRRFKVRTVGAAAGQPVGASDDPAAMAEVVARRLDRLVAAEAQPRLAADSFAYPPHLLVVDGGPTQLAAAVAEVRQRGLGERIAVAALAKRFEELYLPDRLAPVVLDSASPALRLVQTARDEAHRFAISFHRRQRATAMTASPLDAVKGLGPARRQRLLTELGGLTGVRAASREQLQGLGWLPTAVADRVWHALHED